MRTVEASGRTDHARREEGFAAAVAEMAACRARVGVAPRPDLLATLLAPRATPIMRRTAPGSWLIGDTESAVALRPLATAADPSAARPSAPGDARVRAVADPDPSAAPAVVLSVIGPRVRQLLRGCGASVPPVGFAFRTAVGEVPAWVLTEEREHALVVVATGDADACRRALEACGAPLGCVWVGQTALRHLAAAHVLSLA